MPMTYYLGFTLDGRPVHRRSGQDYGYTHAAIALTDTSRLPTFSKSAEGAATNARSNHWTHFAVVEVHKVDRAAYEAAKGKPQALVEPSPAPEAPTVPQAPSRASSLFGDAPVILAKHESREAWMQAFVSASRIMFAEVGAELPQAIRVSIGHPSKGVRSKAIGECWSDASSADGAVEIFIRPTLQSDASRLADVLTHELIHAALGNEEGHGPAFRRTMKRLGLEGKATATVAGPAWHTWADPIVEALGPLPGAELHDMVLAGGKKTQTTRYLKVTCDVCGWQARVTAKHIEGRSLRCPDPDCEGHLEREAKGDEE